MSGTEGKTKEEFQLDVLSGEESKSEDIVMNISPGSISENTATMPSPAQEPPTTVDMFDDNRASAMVVSNKTSPNIFKSQSPSQQTLGVSSNSTVHAFGYTSILKAPSNHNQCDISQGGMPDMVSSDRDIVASSTFGIISPVSLSPSPKSRDNGSLGMKVRT